MITAIILAAGKGERAGFSQNKVLRELNGMPVLCYSLSALSECGEVGELLVACRAEERGQIERLLSPYPNARTVVGGNTRFYSVYAALQAAKGDIVLVHDGARPHITKEIVRNCIACVKEYGSGVCAVPVTDTVLYTENERVQYAIPRQPLYAGQTPQGYVKNSLLNAFICAIEAKTAENFTDESGLYARYVEPPHVFFGDRANKKLTYPEDFMPAERVGFGIDTHAFYGEGEGAPLKNFITLAGVKIPSEKILKAHSDGDVLVHALMDALLSASGLRDIGYYFPDTDEKYAGANSMELLGEVLRLVRGQGLAPQNASISVLAETPRLAPHIEDMKKNLSAALTLPLSAIGIAAGTNERLGYVGEGKGITVYATVILRKIYEN